MLVGRKAIKMIVATMRCKRMGMSLACSSNSLMRVDAFRIKVNIDLNGYEDRIVAHAQQLIRRHRRSTVLSIMKAMPVSPLPAVPRFGLKCHVRNVELLGEHLRRRCAHLVGIVPNDEVRR